MKRYQKLLAGGCVAGLMIRYGNSVVCGIQRNLETGKRGLVLL